MARPKEQGLDSGGTRPHETRPTRHRSVASESSNHVPNEGPVTGCEKRRARLHSGIAAENWEHFLGLHVIALGLFPRDTPATEEARDRVASGRGCAAKAVSACVKRRTSAN